MFKVFYSKNMLSIIKDSSLQTNEKIKITKFITTFQECGIENWNSYEGKIAKSTSNIDRNSNPKEYLYADKYFLWHYHVGHPFYIKKEEYKTSDYLLHFMWDSNSKDIIKLVDYTPHKINGIFPLPEEKKLI